ncbi:MAG: tetratricopeptide repeat protein [Candidatus Omnitrophota bacterium]|nr:MAG: tetratricopeptide repeat protein [Candidatus Omnitrophota bacterium]
MKQKDNKSLTMTKKETRFTLLSIILIIFLGFAVYANSLNGKFLWDDDDLVKNNVYIKNFKLLPNIFIKPIGAGVGKKDSFYRPLQILSYAIDFSLWKLNVVGYHLTNVALHIGVALMLYWLATLLFGDRLLSSLATLLYIVHPAHTAAVAYISGRADSLALLCMLLCFICYLKRLNVKKASVYTWMVASYVCALLSKEFSLILPLTLLLYHYTFRKKVASREFFSLVGIALAYIVFRFTVLGSMLPHREVPVTLLERIPGFFVALPQYIRLLILPFDLHMEYGNKLFSITDPKAIIGLAILLALTLYAFRIRKVYKLIFFSLFWFFITLLPFSGLYPINAYMAEHWLYVPSIGFFLILANFFAFLYRTKKSQIVSVVFVGLLTFYSYLAWRQNTYWKNPRALYERTLKYAPESRTANNNLGLIYYTLGKKEEAIGLFKKTIEIDREYVGGYNNLGCAYRNLGKFEEAVVVFEKAIEIDPQFVFAYNNIGLLYHTMGETKKAIAFFQKAIEINPTYPEPYNNLGVSYATSGKNQEAISSYKKAIQFNPYYADAYHNLGLALYNTGKNKEAITLFKKSLEIDPNYTKAHYNLAVIYFHQNQHSLAIKHCDRAKELGYVTKELLEALRPHRK